MLKILVADDHPLVREGLKHIFASLGKNIVADNAETGEEALRKIKDDDYDLMLLEPRILGLAGLSLIEKIKKRKSRIPLLILTDSPEESFAIRTLKIGASGYLDKNSSAGELFTAIERVLAGKKYMSQSLSEKIAHSLSGERETPCQNKLSNREYEIMQMIASGRELKEIARDLSISSRTVSTYRSRILTKMNLKNNAALSLYAIKHNLIWKIK